MICIGASDFRPLIGALWLTYEETSQKWIGANRMANASLGPRNWRQPLNSCACLDYLWPDKNIAGRKQSRKSSDRFRPRCIRQRRHDLGVPERVSLQRQPGKRGHGGAARLDFAQNIDCERTNANTAMVASVALNPATAKWWRVQSRCVWTARTILRISISDWCRRPGTQLLSTTASTALISRCLSIPAGAARRWLQPSTSSAALLPYMWRGMTTKLPLRDGGRIRC